MKNKDYKGLWIPLYVMEDASLSPSEKMLLSILINLSENHTKSCNASNSYLASKMCFSSRRIQQILSTLKSKGYISARNVFHEGTKDISHRVVKVTSYPSRKGLHIDNKEDRKVYIKKNEELNRVFYNFIKYRQELKKPLAEKSLEAMAQKLVDMSNNTVERAKKIVNQSIEKGWLSLYDLKDENIAKGGLADGVILKQGEFNDYRNIGF
ncbi:helix-turn-helix domain-containing protein [Plebeiibacterium marinum]|uniref:Helix-turn-helix domain-containing protein n=1 Tax=Plebeiibacterium marinum TaxID=2992111 RepID=A0AAE3SK42_9BACT|nr:helix-turn-helix domain-containing protein [Plebeiobacterium marinum]MCW3806123.1 helix-turn-helix domain-containing protein [Plebeiobacterium marinum]